MELNVQCCRVWTTLCKSFRSIFLTWHKCVHPPLIWYSLSHSWYYQQTWHYSTILVGIVKSKLSIFTDPLLSQCNKTFIDISCELNFEIFFKTVCILLGHLCVCVVIVFFVEESSQWKCLCKECYNARDLFAFAWLLFTKNHIICLMKNTEMIMMIIKQQTKSCLIMNCIYLVML